MSFQTWQETLITNAGASGTAISASTTQASIIPPSAKLLIPANYMFVGRQIKIVAQGQISNVVTTPGTLLFQVLYGATAVFNSGVASIPLNIVAKTNVTWWLEILMECRTIGAGTSATMLSYAQFTSESVFNAGAGTANSAFIPPSAPAAGSGFDSTASQLMDLQAKFSVATAGTAMTLFTYKVESLN